MQLNYSLSPCRCRLAAVLSWQCRGLGGLSGCAAPVGGVGREPFGWPRAGHRRALQRGAGQVKEVWKQLAFWAPGFGAAHRSGHLGAPWRHSSSCRGGRRDTGPSHRSPALPRSEPVLALWVSPPAWRGNPKSFLFLACGFSGLNVVVASRLRNDHF